MDLRTFNGLVMSYLLTFLLIWFVSNGFADAKAIPQAPAAAPPPPGGNLPVSWLVQVKKAFL